MRQRLDFLLPTLVLGLAAAIHLPSITNGLPYYLNIDEVNRITTVFSMMSRDSLNPEWFGHPAQPIIYAIYASYRLLYLFAPTGTEYESMPHFVQFLAADAGYALIPGRVIMFVAILLVIFLTYRISLTNGRIAAGLAASLVVLSPVFVREGTAIRNSDVVMAFFVLLVLRFALRELNQSSLKNFLAMGAFVGIAGATKYPGLVSAAIPIAVYAVTRPTDLKRLGWLLLAGVASIVAAFAVGPYLFIDLGEMLSSVVGEARPSHLSATGEAFFADALWFLKRITGSGVGVAGAFLAVFGFIAVLRKAPKQALVIGIFPVLLVLFLSSLHLRWERWIIPLIPFAAIFAGAGFSFLCALLRPCRSNSRMRGIALIAVGSLFLATPAIATFNTLKSKALPDTRVLAAEWIEQNIEKKSGFWIEMHGPQISVNDYRVFDIRGGRLIVRRQGSGFLRAIPRVKFGEVFSRLDRRALVKTLDVLQRSGLEYLVLTNFQKRYESEQARLGGQERFLQVYDTLLEHTKLVFSAAPEKGVSHGQSIRILELNP